MIFTNTFAHGARSCYVLYAPAKGITTHAPARAASLTRNAGALIIRIGLGGYFIHVIILRSLKIAWVITKALLLRGHPGESESVVRSCHQQLDDRGFPAL